MAAKRKVSIPSKGASFLKAPSIGINAGTSVEDHIAHAVERAQKGEVIYAADYLEQKAGRLPNPAALKLLLAAAQLIDSTNPNRAKSILERAIQMDPKCGPAHLGLAVVLSNLGESKASIEHLRDAVLLPLSPAQKILTSVMLSKYNLLAPALDMAKKAFYELGKPLNQASNCLDIALQIADWDFAEELIEILRQAHKDGRTLEANEATKTHILWCDDEATNIEVIKAWSQRTFPDYKPKTKRIKENPEGRRLRIGYLSSDYRNHPTAWLANGLFRNHDKTKFELFLYDSGWDDGSDIRKEVLSNFQHIYSVADLDDVAAASLIDGHHLDILVELNGPTKANRMGILAHRPAPIQICYLGWPGSAGGRFVDYIIADEYILPQEQAKLYPEKIIWLSDTYQINDYAARALPPPPTKQELGFSEDTVVVGMFNSINKVRREVWAAWMEIIKSCPKAIFWVLDPGPDARENLAKETIRAGVDLDRIVIAPKMQQMEHLRRLQVCDLILDPWPIGGHTSTADALFAGVPIVVMRGNSYASRVSGGILTISGLNEMVCECVGNYVTLAKGLITDFDFLKKLKKTWRDSGRPKAVFNSTKRVSEIESLYLSLLLDKFANQNFPRQSVPHLSNPINLAVVIPPGYPHYQAFDELLDFIDFSLTDLGFRVERTINSLTGVGLSILVGAHLLKDDLPVSKKNKDLVIINTEQLGADDSPNWTTRLLGTLSKHEVWDYSRRNIEFCATKLGLNHKYLQLGFHEKLNRLRFDVNRDIDVLFYGCVTPRRREILQQLVSMNLNVKAVFGVYGKARDSLIERSKLVLNLHAYDTQIHEAIRTFYLMNNSVAYISEHNETSSIDPDHFVEGVLWRRSEIATNARRILNEKSFMSLGRAGYEKIKKISGPDVLEILLDS